MTPACDHDSVEGERTLTGKTAVREWMQRTYREPPRFHVQRIIAEDDCVLRADRLFAVTP